MFSGHSSNRNKNRTIHVAGKRAVGYNERVMDGLDSENLVLVYELDSNTRIPGYLFANDI